MAEDQCRCARCGTVQPAPEPLGHGLRAVKACSECRCLIVSASRDLGELGNPDDRADPTDWGDCGWT